MPVSVITRLIKEGQPGDNKVIMGADVKKAFS